MRTLATLAAAACAASASASAPIFSQADVKPTAFDAWPTTVPFWPQYGRKTTVLNGTWQFGFAMGIDPVSIPYGQISTPNSTTVPGAFDVAPPGVVGPRGNAFFRSSHACTPGVPALLKFSAVNFYARVFVDGADIGNHTAGGYTPFQMVAPACASSGQRELLVVVNNQQNASLAPTYTGGDFYFYSGIIRPVIVTELPTGSNPFFIDHIHPVTVDYTRGIIDIRVGVAAAAGSLPSSVHLSYSFNGGAASPSTEYPLVNGTAVIGNVPVPAFKLWQIGKDNTDNLFTLQVTETASGDSVTVRSGIRQVGIDPATARITINGESPKLLGFNRHTMWPDTGAAVTQVQEAADLALLKGVNANYVRGAHYPQSQSWLDRLDEAGIVLWEETLGPGVSTHNIQDPWFMANHLTAIKSMVTTSFAHPSVIMHAFFNEGPSSDPAACSGYAASSQAIRDVLGTNPMRLVTWANDKTTGDVCIAYEDVISFNSYPGWYDHPDNVTYPDVFWGQHVAWVQQNWPTKPLTISETGGGGIYEWKNDTYPFPGLFWSQHYQANLVPVDAAYLAGNDRVTGLTLWQFADIKANDGDTKQCGACQWQQPIPANLTSPWTCAYFPIDPTKCGRPGGFNHKGTVDFWRRVKEEYPILAAIYGNYTKAA